MLMIFYFTFCCFDLFGSCFFFTIKLYVLDIVKAFQDNDICYTEQELSEDNKVCRWQPNSNSNCQ